MAENGGASGADTQDHPAMSVSAAGDEVPDTVGATRQAEEAMDPSKLSDPLKMRPTVSLCAEVCAVCSHLGLSTYFLRDCSIRQSLPLDPFLRLILCLPAEDCDGRPLIVSGADVRRTKSG